MDANRQQKKAVVKFKSGKLIKGYIDDFASSVRDVVLTRVDNRQISINVDDLKAVFFVRSFDGDFSYNESKSFSHSSRDAGKKRVFVKFLDKESVTGYLDKDIPWQTGFFLSKPDERKTGFFLYPADERSNNMKIYVVNSAVEDVTLIG